MNWPKLYGYLPDDADRVEFRKAVEAALAIYKREAPDPNAPPWEQVIETFDKVLAETRRFNSLYRVRPYMLNDVLRSRMHAAFQLQLEQELAKKREERLYDNLIIACAGVGRLQPSVSISGPMTRVLKIILDHVIPHAGHQTGPKKAEGDHSLTESAIKGIVRRHLDRRGGKVPLDSGLDSLPG
jgi:hypothetical protein